MFKLVLKKFQDMFKKEETIKTGLRISRRKLGFEILEGRELLSAGGFGDNYIYDSNEYEQSSYYESGSSNYSLSQTSGYFTQSSSVTIPDALYSSNQDIVLDGTGSSFITISDTSDLDTISSQVTFRSVFTAANTGGFKYLIAHDVENNVGKELFMRIRNGNLQFGTWTGVHTGGTNYLVETAVTVGQTYDAIGTYDGQYWRLYLNGILRAELQDIGRDISVPSNFNNGSFNPVWLIGAHGTETDRRVFCGVINDAEVFGTALTPEQIGEISGPVISLSGPTKVNNVLPIYAESTQDKFDIVINRSNGLNNPFPVETNYDLDFKLTISGTAEKEDFEIYDGATLISGTGNYGRWSNGDKVFSYKIPTGKDSVKLTFKIVDNQEVEDSEETLTITLTDASVTLNGKTQDLKIETPSESELKIKNDFYNVKWQTITGTDANKATISADPNSGGQRVFPEKSTPTGEIENKIELVFTLEAAATAATTLYFKIFDPDNFIGLGNDNAAANAWTGDDNYATTSITTGSVTIAQGATSTALTIVVYPAGYTVPTTVPANTIFITSAHAGDNFIVVVDSVQANVNNAALGTTEATRYKETDNLTQSELLTVWGTLNVELDMMYIPGVDDVGNQLPFQFGDDYADQGILGDHLVSEFRRACIEVIEFTPNSNPSVAGDIVMDVTTLGNHLGSRNLATSEAEFWGILSIGAFSSK